MTLCCGIRHMTRKMQNYQRRFVGVAVHCLYTLLRNIYRKPGSTRTTHFANYASRPITPSLCYRVELSEDVSRGLVVQRSCEPRYVDESGGNHENTMAKVNQELGFYGC